MTTPRDRRSTCRRCGNLRRLRDGRGLCPHCHQTMRLAGRLDEYPEVRYDTQRRVKPLWQAGMGAAEISRELGITRNAAWCAIRALRKKEEAVTGYRYESPNGMTLWERLSVPHPGIDDVECKSRHDLFADWLEGNTRHPMRHGVPETWAQRYIAEALAVCARCPVQEWCVTATKPDRSKVSIIAGGAVWHDGKPVWTLADQERLEAAQARDGAA